MSQNKITVEIIADFSRVEKRLAKLRDFGDIDLAKLCCNEIARTFSVPQPYFVDTQASAESAKKQAELHERVLRAYVDTWWSGVRLVDTFERFERLTRELIPPPHMRPAVAYAVLLLVMAAIVLLA